MWGVMEHENLMKVLDKMGRFDGLDLSNIAAAEMAFRRVQLIEYFYSDKGPGVGRDLGRTRTRTKSMKSCPTNPRLPSSLELIVNLEMLW